MGMAPLVLILFLLICNTKLLNGETVDILGRSYDMAEVKSYPVQGFYRVPIWMEYNSQDVKIFMRNIGFSLGSNFSSFDRIQESPDMGGNLTDNNGNFIIYMNNSEISFFDLANQQMYKVSTENSKPFQIRIDYGRSLLYILSSSTNESKEGLLYALDLTNIIPNNDTITAQQVEQVGDQLTAISVNPDTGSILISKKIFSKGSVTVKIFKMDPHQEVSSDVYENTSESVSPKIIIEENEFEETLKEIFESITQVHFKNIENSMKVLTRENTRLKNMVVTLNRRLDLQSNTGNQQNKIDNIENDGNSFIDTLDTYKAQLIRIYKKNGSRDNSNTVCQVKLRRMEEQMARFQSMLKPRVDVRMNGVL